MYGPNITFRLWCVPLLKYISSPTSNRNPIGPTVPSIPPPGINAPFQLRARKFSTWLVNVANPGGAEPNIKFTNPPFASRNGRMCPCPNPTFGPNNPCSVRTPVFVNIKDPPLDVDVNPSVNSRL